MRGSLCAKLYYSAPSTVATVDRTPAVIDPIAIYSSRIVIFAYHTCIRRPR